MSSKRLPGKILKNISNKTLLKRIVERVRLIKKIDNIIIATSKNKNDDPIVQYAKKEGGFL